MANKEKDLTKERNDKLAPVAQAVIELIAKAKLPVGDIHAHDNPKFAAVAQDVIQQMMDSDVKYVDTSFAFQLVLQPFDNIMQIVQKSLGESFNKANNKLFGKEYRELTLNDLDKILKDKLSTG